MRSYSGSRVDALPLPSGEGWGEGGGRSGLRFTTPRELRNLHPKVAGAGTARLAWLAACAGAIVLLQAVACFAEDAPFITNVKAASKKTYPVVPKLVLNEKVYMEPWEPSKYADVPGEVAGACFIQTSRKDSTATDAKFLTFDVAKPATVYVGYRGGQKKPDWLDKTWTDTGLTLETSARMRMMLHKKEVPAGEVTLGGNAAGGGASTMMYVVVVKPTAEKK